MVGCGDIEEGEVVGRHWWIVAQGLMIAAMDRIGNSGSAALMVLMLLVAQMLMAVVLQ